MSKFVDECRREWKRLGVADAIANEMAADLETDLAEAEADGAAPEDVLGNGVFDAKGFAASWAAERGVIPPAPPRERLPGKSRTLSVVVAVTAVLMIGLGFGLVRSHAHTSVAVVAARTTFGRLGGVAVLPPRPMSPAEAKLALPQPDLAVADKMRRFGWVLLILGLAGLIVAAVIWPREHVRRGPPLPA